MNKVNVSKLAQWFFVVVASTLMTAASAQALIIANGPDDICPPGADPCVVTDKVEIQAPGILDFGLRTLQVAPGGQLQQTADISCGAFLVTTGTSAVAVDSNNGGGDAGTFTVTAFRACSGDGATPCLDDSLCAGLTLGTCSVGDGSIDIAAKLNGKGGPGGIMTFRAAGDIVIDGTVTLNSTQAGERGGTLNAESFAGSVTLLATVKSKGGNPAEYLSEPDSGGEVRLNAALDVMMQGDLDLSGGSNGGSFYVQADRDTIVSNSVNVNAGKLLYAYGGVISMTAGRDVHVQAPDSTTRLSSNGSQAIYSYGGGYFAQVSGDGGYTILTAGNDVTLDEKVIVESRSGMGGYDSQPYGGTVEITATGTATVNGDIISEGRGGLVPQGGDIKIDASQGIFIGANSFLDIQSKRGGLVELRSDGQVDISGRIDVRGGPTPYYFPYSYAFDSDGGVFNVQGAADVTVSGLIQNGANGGSEQDIRFDVCRLTLQSGAKIDHTHGGGDFNSSNLFSIGESMTVEPGAEVLANGQFGEVNQIRYRDPNKPPVINGTMNPPANLIVDPSLVGCPVCGNSEIDEGESCDDGNLVSGDGCRDDCQDEGCLAETPGFPGVPICDDGDACTVDICDDVAHTCNNIASCEEGIACTVDSCVLGACEHTPVDSLCDDGNECTDNVCSAVSGCLEVPLTGGACEDGDICTVASTCDSGNCVASTVTLVEKSRIKIRVRDGDEDKLTVKGDLPLAAITSQPTVTGMLFQLQDGSDTPIVVATLPNTAWDDLGGGLKFRFRDKDGLVAGAAGITSVSMRVVSVKDVVKFKAKGRDMDLEGALDQVALTMSVLLGTDPVTEDCVTARRVPCTTKNGVSVSCKN